MFDFGSFPISETNEAMRKVLNRTVVPDLKRRGFSGKMPHFRRILDGRVDVLGVQFNRYGGSFVIEIGSCGIAGITHPTAGHVPAEKVRHYDIPLLRRLRLGSDPSSTFSRDHWFAFRRGTIIKNFDYEAPAMEVLDLLGRQAEPYWSSYMQNENGA